MIPQPLRHKWAWSDTGRSPESTSLYSTTARTRRTAVVGRQPPELPGGPHWYESLEAIVGAGDIDWRCCVAQVSTDCMPSRLPS